ncbi:unnamed protein product [Didymodactylos carnosus]|uniref:Uncharacterized protein n=1 Tax=Didymodactylos carnosus TaxID=1234261 RepID=A0A8S2CM96_9BILA|nr:unnamed protein product [Didymodactylos carnosus]CAF3526004.1 unnamed protein product [Didymodactylos carnosus]
MRANTRKQNYATKRVAIANFVVSILLIIAGAQATNPLAIVSGALGLFGFFASTLAISGITVGALAGVGVFDGGSNNVLTDQQLLDRLVVPVQVRTSSKQLTNFRSALFDSKISNIDLELVKLLSLDFANLNFKEAEIKINLENLPLLFDSTAQQALITTSPNEFNAALLNLITAAYGLEK